MQKRCIFTASGAGESQNTANTMVSQSRNRYTYVGYVLIIFYWLRWSAGTKFDLLAKRGQWRLHWVARTMVPNPSLPVCPRAPGAPQSAWCTSNQQEGASWNHWAKNAAIESYTTGLFNICRSYKVLTYTWAGWNHQPWDCWAQEICPCVFTANHPFFQWHPTSLDITIIS